MSKKPKPPEIEDPRQRIRIYKDGLELLAEFYVEPNQKKIDVDVYINQHTPVITVHVNNPLERVKDS